MLFKIFLVVTFTFIVGYYCGCKMTAQSMIISSVCSTPMRIGRKFFYIVSEENYIKK